MCSCKHSSDIVLYMDISATSLSSFIFVFSSVLEGRSVVFNATVFTLFHDSSNALLLLTDTLESRHHSDASEALQTTAVAVRCNRENVRQIYKSS